LGVLEYYIYFWLHLHSSQRASVDVWLTFWYFILVSPPYHSTYRAYN
jgi:hypothetical protein